MRRMYDLQEDQEYMQQLIDEINPEEISGLITLQFKPGGAVIPRFSCSVSQLALAISSLQAEFQRVYDQQDD